mmetsp:Transcript_46520/g.109341  ORF Transcript_46520/g.109341 Transcript_46520/m.109341 type:complete len:274 (+) Transcript_46520:255-1076(+)
MRLHVLAALGLCLGRGAEVVVGGHDHEGEHALRDDVHDGVRNHLEGDREGGEALGEEPHNGVERPHDDGQPGDLSVQLDHLRVLARDHSLAEGARQGVHHRQEHSDGEEEPEPLDGGHHGDGTHVQGNNHQHVSADDSGKGNEILAGDEAESEDDEWHGDEPVHIAGIEELPATRDRGPTLAREHGEVRESGNTADESAAEVVLPALTVGAGSLGDHDNGGHGEGQEAQSEGTDAGGSNLLDGGACGGRKGLGGGRSARKFCERHGDRKDDGC